MKFHIIINPGSASGTASHYWNSIQYLFNNTDYTLHFSTLDHDIDDICRELSQDLSEDINIIVLGGDGTMNAAINGIQDFDHVRLGLIPCGSGNDMIRDMGLSKDATANIRKILEGKIVRKADIGEVVFGNTHARIDKTDHHITKELSTSPAVQRFNVSAGIGFDANVCQQAAVSKAKKFFNTLHCGQLIYVFKALGIVFANEQFDAEVTYCCEHDTGSGQSRTNSSYASLESGKTQDSPNNISHALQLKQASFIACMNHQYEGGGFRFCPDADFNDGKLDVCTANGFTNALRFIKVFIHALTGTHIKYTDYVKQLKVSSIHITADKPMWVHADGEVLYSSTDITVRLLKDRLKLLF